MNIKLTQLSQGGGCGCKIAPAVLAELLAATPLRPAPPDLLVGTETADDAAVYRLNARQALVATTDFFTPIVDDPFDFGRIAATNALSDIYAMGGRPILALAVVGMPLDRLPIEAIGRILAGGASVCAQAGVPIVGGHSIDVAEPIYGLAALGLAHPDRIKRNCDARPGDVLILGKPLGIGILSAALKKGVLTPSGYAAMIEHTTRLNTPGTKLANMDGVHALTDVTGFGLIGHLLGICKGSGVGACVRWGELPVIHEAVEFVQQGVFTGASTRNWNACGGQIELPAEFADWQRHLLADPQTSGGLLVTCAPDCAPAVLATFHKTGFAAARAIGTLTEGPPLLKIIPAAA